MVIVLFQLRTDYPLIVAANREERRDRPSTAPFRWESESARSAATEGADVAESPRVSKANDGPRIWAGRDDVAGGTWLGVNSAGMVAAITNRPERPVDPSLPSRGALCLSTLRATSPGAALGVVASQLRASRYNPFNLVCADSGAGWITTWQGGPRPLAPGGHIVSNRGDPDDSSLPVVRRARTLLKRVDLEVDPLDALLRQLGDLCANTRGQAPICRPSGDRGTVSSSLIALNARGSVAAYWHANGPPSEVAYEPVNIG